MKKIIVIIFIFSTSLSFAQGPEQTESGFNISSLITGFTNAIASYKIRSSIKIKELDRTNIKLTDSYLDLIVEMNSAITTSIFKFEDTSLDKMSLSLEIAEPNLLTLLNLKIISQIPYENTKNFILNNNYISSQFFNFYPIDNFNPIKLKIREGLRKDESLMTPQYISGSLKFYKQTTDGQYSTHHLKILVKSKINEDVYELTNCSLTGLLMPLEMHLFYNLKCDYKLKTENKDYGKLLGNGIQEGANINGFIDLNGELDPALYDSSLSL